MDLPAGAYLSAVDAIGHTPLIRLNQITSHLQGSEIWVKLERCNPGGSIKDRIALQMILDGEAAGHLKPGGTIIEATSGNTGIGIAMVAAQRGYNCIFTIPDKMSQEKIDLLSALGAEVHVCPTAVEKEDPRSYYEVAARLAREIPNSWYPDQYSHSANPRAHELSTGPEIWRQTNGEITHLVATMGTGGTITGCATSLYDAAKKEGKVAPQIVGVDPIGSILKQYFEKGTMGEPHTYLVEGFGEDFIPTATDFTHIDEIRQVDDEICFKYTRALARTEGLFCGGSAGGALYVAMQLAVQSDERGEKAKIVVILPDAGNPYLSKLYNDEWLRENGFEPDGWG